MLKTIKKGFLAVALAFVTLFALASCNIFGTTTADPSQAANTALTEFTAQVTFPNLNETKADFNLPIAGVKGSYNIPITWTSSDPTIIQITDLIENGATSLKYKLAKVTKPATDTKVVLTADFSLTYTKADGTTATLKAQKTFTFNVVGGGSGSGSGSGEVPTVPGALTLTLDFNTNATTWLDIEDNVSTTEKTFEASGITFGYKAGYGSSYDGKSFMMLAKGQNPSLYNKTALPGEIVSVSVVVPTGSSESAIYHLDLFVAENNGNITSSNTLTGPGTLTATAQASQGFKYFNISKAQTGDDPSKDKNGQIIQIVINYMPPQKADADKVAEDKEALTLPANTEGNVTLPTTGTNGSTITWEVKEGSSAMTNAGVVTRGATDVTVKLTATITSGTEKQTKDFTIVVKAKYAAVEGVAAVDKNNTYKLVINQAATEQVLWLNGLVEDRFAATTLDKEAAAVFHLEETTGGYHIYTTDGTTKKYLCITTVQQGTETKKKVDFAATSNVVWVWNATHKTMTTTFNSQELFLGTYSTFKTASYNEIAKIAEDGTYVLQFVLDTGTTPELSDADKVAADKAELLTKLPAEVTADFQLPTQGTLGSAITWAVKTGQGITIEGNTAKVTQTDTAQIVVLTATVQLGGATETQEVSVTIKAAEQTGGEDPDTPTAGQVVITSDKLVQNAATSGYAQYAGAQNFDGVACNITDIMKNNSDLQFKKNTGEIKNTAALAKNITEVILVVQSGKAISLSVGATAGALTAVTLPAADTTTKTGYDIYTCVIEAGNVFFKVANTSSNASYLESITIKFGDSATTPTEKTPEQKVAEVKAYLTAELGKLTLTDVTADITLPTSSLADVTVVWASNNPTVVANDGKVTRPAYNADPATAKATLTATISCGETAKATLTQDVTVKLKEATDEEKVADAKTELQTAVTNLGTSTTLNPTTSSLQLPATVSNGSTVTWAITEGSNYASLDGTTAGLLKVTEANRPAWNAANDATVKLTATIKSNVEENKEVTVTVTINKKVATDADKVADAKTQLQELVNDLTNKVLNETTSTVKLPADAINGATITWAADADTYVTVDANGLVTLKENALPAWNAENGKVVLTATIQLNEADKKEVTVEITVEKKQPTTKDLLDDAAAALELTGVNLEAVTQNVTLPTSGNNETKIAWVSDKPAVVANDGTVTRPTFGQGAATVKLTATLTIEGKEGTATKEFTLTVPEAAQTDDAKIAEAKSALDTQITALNKALAVGTDALTLPSQPTNGAAIKYEVTAGEAYVKVEEGKVVVIARPEYKEAAATATIKATVSCGNGTAQTATIELTINPEKATDDELITDAKSALDTAITDLNKVLAVGTDTLTLPSQPTNGAATKYEVTAGEAYVKVEEGKVVVIARPNYGETDATATVTATVTCGNGTAQTATIDLTIAKKIMTDADKVAEAKEELTLPAEATEDFALPATGAHGTSIAWEVKTGDAISIDESTAKITRSFVDTEVILTAKITLGTAKESKDITVTVKALTPEKVATFEFGANDSSKDDNADGSSIDTYKEYSNGFKLQLESLKKVYSASYDKDGNSCLKLGTGNDAASFTFTVGEYVAKVVINIAGYKANNASIKINKGEEQSITTHSEDAAYTAIEVDTITNKTIILETTGSGKRAKVNSIEYWGKAMPEKTAAEKVSIDKSELMLENTSVYKDFELPTLGIVYSSTIEWAVKTGNAITVEGSTAKVTRGAADEEVVLVATIAPGTAEADTKEITVTVLGIKVAPEATAKTIAELLAIPTAEELTATYTTTATVAAFGKKLDVTDADADQYGNMILEDNGSKIIVYGATAKTSAFTWNDVTGKYSFSNDKKFLTNELTKTIVVGSEVKLLVACTSSNSDSTRQLYAIVLEVKVPELTDAGKVAADKEELTLDAEVTADFTLRTTGTNGSTIAWAVTSGDAITIEEGVAKVTRGETDAEVKLTATITNGEADDTKEFTVTVKAPEVVSGPTTINYVFAEKGLTNEIQYLTHNLDANATLTLTGEGNTGKYYDSGTSIRIYQTESPTINIAVTNGYSISKVTITFTVTKTGTLLLDGTAVVSGEAIVVNNSSILFTVGNSGTATNGQVRISQITVEYAPIA